MKKVLLTITLTLIIFASAMAQTKGASLPNISYSQVNTNLPENINYKTNFSNSHGLTIGFQKDIRVYNRLFISPGIGIQRAGSSSEVESKNKTQEILKREISGSSLNALFQFNLKGYIVNKDKWRLFSSLNYEYNYGLQTSITTTDHTANSIETTSSTFRNRLNSYINNNYFGLSLGYEKQFNDRTFWYTRISRLTNSQGYADEAAIAGNGPDFNTRSSHSLYRLTLGIRIANK